MDIEFRRAEKAYLAYHTAHNTRPISFAEQPQHIRMVWISIVRAILPQAKKSSRKALVASATYERNKETWKLTAVEKQEKAAAKRKRELAKLLKQRPKGYKLPLDFIPDY